MERLNTISKHINNNYTAENNAIELTPEEKLKYIDFNLIKFPEVNPVHLISKDIDGKDVVIANYRYPSTKKDTKGIVFLLHGYGEYVGRYGYLGKEFAELGYDFFGMDLKGFGNSGGLRGYIDSEKQIFDDFLAYFDLVERTYNIKDQKKYLLGYSFGGYQSVKLTILKPGYFTGVMLLAPYFDMRGRRKLESMLPMIEEFSKTNPTDQIDLVPMQPLPPNHLMHFVTDPLNEGVKVRSRTQFIITTVFRGLSESQIRSFNLPLISILGEKEQVVDNNAIKKFHENCGSKNTFIVIQKGVDHLLFHDKEQVKFVMSSFKEFLSKY